MHLFNRYLSKDINFKLTILVLLSYFLFGCDQPPPTNEQIFVNPPASTSFDTDQGKVKLSALSATDVCYTINGQTPALDNGRCKGEGNQTYDQNIDLYCETGETGESVIKEVKLVFRWRSLDSSELVNRSALFFLNCDHPASQTDTDNDTIPDVNDNCPINPNTDQLDEDDDGVGDACDDDADNDGIADDIDNCPSDANSNQIDADQDGIGDACDLDADNDGVENEKDNCPDAPNPDQTDGDKDGIGDVCDSLFDTDQDGIEDNLDNCPFNPNATQNDSDGDGIGDTCDPDPFVGTEKFFYEYESLLDRLITSLECAFNNCNPPDGTFNWTINPNNSDLESGSANWKATINSFFPPTARTTFTANSAVLEGCIGNGSASGIVNSSGTGDMKTSNPISFSCDGQSGFIEMNLRLTRGKVTGGYYDAFCDSDACEDTVVRFRIIGKEGDGTLIYSTEIRSNALP